MGIEISDKKPERVTHQEMYIVPVGKEDIIVRYSRYEFKNKSPKEFVGLDLNGLGFDVQGNFSCLREHVLNHPKRVKALQDCLPDYVLSIIPFG